SGDDPRASLFVVEAEKTPGMTLPSSGILPFVSSIAESPMLLVVPPDARSYLISWSHDQPGSFRLGPARPLRTMEPVVLRDERPVYRLATLAHEAGTGLWSGRISGTIEGAGGRRATMAALGVILRAGANTLTAEVQPMSPNAPGGRKALGVYLAQTRSVLSVLQPSGEIIDAPGDGSFTTRDLVVDLGYPSSVGGDPKAITDVELIIALWLAVPPPARAPQP
ncbi:MAG: hypothetical protein U0359_20715, partial [Byssovorax sp.]